MTVSRAFAEDRGLRGLGMLHWGHTRCAEDELEMAPKQKTLHKWL